MLLEAVEELIDPGWPNTNLDLSAYIKAGSTRICLQGAALHEGEVTFQEKFSAGKWTEWRVFCYQSRAQGFMWASGTEGTVAKAGEADARGVAALRTLTALPWGQAMVHRVGSPPPHYCVNASWFLPLRVSGFERPGTYHPSLVLRMRPTNRDKIAIGKIFCYSQFPRGEPWALVSGSLGGSGEEGERRERALTMVLVGRNG